MPGQLVTYVPAKAHTQAAMRTRPRAIDAMFMGFATNPMGLALTQGQADIEWTEQCQAACGIARMWATLFWSMQFANAVACLYLHYHRERGLTLLGAAHKLIVGTTLLKAYLGGVIYWPIGLAGPAIEWMFALLFLNEVRGM